MYWSPNVFCGNSAGTFTLIFWTVGSNIGGGQISWQWQGGGGGHYFFGGENTRGVLSENENMRERTLIIIILLLLKGVLSVIGEYWIIINCEKVLIYSVCSWSSRIPFSHFSICVPWWLWSPLSFHQNSSISFLWYSGHRSFWIELVDEGKPQVLFVCPMWLWS